MYTPQILPHIIVRILRARVRGRGGVKDQIAYIENLFSPRFGYAARRSYILRSFWRQDTRIHLRSLMLVLDY